jgi:hypothetical protein
VTFHSWFACVSPSLKRKSMHFILKVIIISIIFVVAVVVKIYARYLRLNLFPLTPYFFETWWKYKAIYLYFKFVSISNIFFDIEWYQFIDIKLNPYEVLREHLSELQTHRISKGNKSSYLSLCLWHICATNSISFLSTVPLCFPQFWLLNRTERSSSEKINSQERFFETRSMRLRCA